MNSRLLLLFLLLAGFMIIWSDDQKKADEYLASVKQEKQSPEFVLNCFPENNLVAKQLEKLNQWSTGIANFDPTRMQSIDMTIKELFPSPLKIASLCPEEEKVVAELRKMQASQPKEEAKDSWYYIKTASKVLNWMRQQSDAVKLEEQQLLLMNETPLMDRIADEIYKSIEKSFQQIQSMTETYRQAVERTEKTSRIASEPKSDSKVQ